MTICCKSWCVYSCSSLYSIENERSSPMKCQMELDDEQCASTVSLSLSSHRFDDNQMRFISPMISSTYEMEGIGQCNIVKKKHSANEWCGCGNSIIETLLRRKKIWSSFIWASDQMFNFIDLIFELNLFTCSNWCRVLSTSEAPRSFDVLHWHKDTNSTITRKSSQEKGRCSLWKIVHANEKLHRRRDDQK